MTSHNCLNSHLSSNITGTFFHVYLPFIFVHRYGGFSPGRLVSFFGLRQAEYPNERRTCQMFVLLWNQRQMAERAGHKLQSPRHTPRDSLQIYFIQVYLTI